MRVIRNCNDSDGVCFASVAGRAGCHVLSAAATGCGTYECPFYKPADQCSWIRIDRPPHVCLISADEYFSWRNVYVK